MPHAASGHGGRSSAAAPRPPNQWPAIHPVVHPSNPTKAMLKTAQHLKNVVTIFHNPQLKASRDMVAKLQKHFKDEHLQKLDLQIDENVPTADQFKALKSYTPLLSNVSSPSDLPRPTLVSWFNGKVAVNNPERALAIVNASEEK